VYFTTAFVFSQFSSIFFLTLVQFVFLWAFSEKPPEKKKTLKLHLKKKNGGLSEEYFFPTFKGVEKEKKGL